MSFRCKTCGLAQPSGVRPHRVVTGIRLRTYWLGGIPAETATGYEISTEADICEACFATCEVVEAPVQVAQLHQQPAAQIYPAGGRRHLLQHH